MSGLSDNAAVDAWIEFASSNPGQSDRYLYAGAEEVTREAAEHAARAAALDPRFADLHKGMSGYAQMTARTVAVSTDSVDEAKEYFELIRLGCERARALSPG